MHQPQVVHLYNTPVYLHIVESYVQDEFSQWVVSRNSYKYFLPNDRQSGGWRGAHFFLELFSLSNHPRGCFFLLAPQVLLLLFRKGFQLPLKFRPMVIFNAGGIKHCRELLMDNCSSMNYLGLNHLFNEVAKAGLYTESAPKVPAKSGLFGFLSRKYNNVPKAKTSKICPISSKMTTQRYLSILPKEAWLSTSIFTCVKYITSNISYIGTP
ncbi:hypothetical protein Pelo_16812 [Pelomyxa schiedti]|nr:hypothetical protein Pelo_16812 [Pelomyxa schiedti]